MKIIFLSFLIAAKINAYAMILRVRRNNTDFAARGWKAAVLNVARCSFFGES